MPAGGLTALMIAGVLAGAAQAAEPPTAPPPAAPQRAVVVAPYAELLTSPGPDAAPAGAVFRDQVVALDALDGDGAHVVRADGVSGWLDAVATTPAPACAPRALGLPFRGRLRCGWALAADTDTWTTWDFPLGTSPNRRWRRHGTARLIEAIERVAGAFHAAHPTRRLVIGDLSRPLGGPFGRRYGGAGHASHQNGLDVDVFLPRRDGAPEPPRRPSDVDLALAREVVRRFADEATRYLFVGCERDYLLRGVRKVQRLCNGHHEDHVHVRMR